jgi:putative sterol carrier protein
MEAMQLGRIQIDGDMMKLMSLAGLQADPAGIELAKSIREITA